MNSKKPPQNIEAEKSVLGSMMIEKDAIHIVSSLLKKEDFYYQSHQAIYGTIIKLYEQDINIDLVTLTEELRRLEQIEKVGGVAYLTELLNSVPTASNVKYYAKIIKNLSDRRRLLLNVTQIQQDCYDESLSLQEIIQKAENQTFDLAQNQKIGKAELIKEYIPETLSELEYLHVHKGEVPPDCIQTPFTLLNQLLSIRKDHLVIIAGRPSMGKSALALELAEHVALKQNLPIALFSLEMGKREIITRLFAMHNRIEGKKIDRGWIKDSDWTKITLTSGKLANSKFILCDMGGISPAFVRNESRRVKRLFPSLALIVVDYIQLMSTSLNPKYFNRNAELTVISNSLKNTAKDLQVPIIAVSQLNRACEYRKEDKRPILADLRDSGSIEQDADSVLMLYREGYYDKNVPDTIAELLIRKQRSGPTGLVPLHWSAKCMRFDNLEKKEEH